MPIADTLFLELLDGECFGQVVEQWQCFDATVDVLLEHFVRLLHVLVDASLEEMADVVVGKVAEPSYQVEHLSLFFSIECHERDCSSLHELSYSM